MEFTQNTEINTTASCTSQPSENPEVKYNGTDFVFALLLLFFGYIFHICFFSFQPGLGVLLINAFVFIVMTAYFMKKKVLLTLKGLILPISAVVISAAIFYTGSVLLCVLSFFYSFFAFTLGALIITKNSIEGFLGDYSYFDALKALFVMPFCRLFSLFGALGSFNKKKSGRIVLYIVLGILLTIVPTAIILSLLISSDNVFSALVEKMYNSYLNNIFSRLITAVAMLPVSLYFFGLLYSNSNKLCGKVLTKESSENVKSTLSFCPPAIICSALTPILIIYLIFFTSQFAYFTSAFSSLLPEGFSYAEYARQGFFELCAISFINGWLLMLSNVCSKKAENKSSIVLKIYNILLILSTLILISTALSKMFLYINEYGLTRLRVYTSLFMLLLVLIFLFALIKQLSRKFNFVLTSFIATFVFLLAFSFSNVDARIAEYNINKYMENSEYNLDVSHLYELSNSAVEYAIPLIDADIPEEMKTSVKHYISAVKQRVKSEKKSFLTFNLEDHRIEKLLADIDLS